MRADTNHTVTAEQLMAYLDGEGTQAERSAVRAHLDACRDCQTRAADQGDASAALARWRIEPAPSTLRPKIEPRRMTGRHLWHSSRFVLASLTAAAAVVLVVAYQIRVPSRGSRGNAMTVSMSEGAFDAPRRAGGGAGGGVAGHAAAAPVERSVAGKAIDAIAPASRTAAVIRTATLALVAKDFPAARAAVDALIARVGGFADQLGVTEDAGSARVLRGTLRIPGDRLSQTLAELRTLGHVTQDQQNAQDVTDQLIDLDARLASSRATEQRLIELLKNRTGKLSDVLEVERELTRVRLDIERLDAEKQNVGRRVTYATIDLTIGEERKAGLESGPLPLATRLRVAAADGLEGAFESLVGAAVFVLRAGPTLMLWGIAAGTVVLIVRRARSAASRQA